MPRRPKPDDERLDCRIELRLTETEKDAFVRAAAEDGISTVSEWLRWVARKRLKRHGRPRTDAE